MTAPIADPMSTFPAPAGSFPAPAGPWRRPRFWIALLLTVVSLVLTVLHLVGGVSALGELFGPPVVSSSQVASQIQARVPGTVASCPEDLPAQVGATVSCSVVDGTDNANVRATVTAVDGDDVHYDLDVVG